MNAPRMFDAPPMSPEAEALFKQIDAAIETISDYCAEFTKPELRLTGSDFRAACELLHLNPLATFQSLQRAIGQDFGTRDPVFWRSVREANILGDDARFFIRGAILEGSRTGKSHVLQWLYRVSAALPA
jgi:hypothetical protein